jgi:flavodoxin
MGERRALVVYYSRTGTTAKVGRAVADALGADVEEIVDTADRRGLLGWLRSGRDAFRKRKAAIGPVARDPAAYDVVVVGTPVWAGSMTPAVRTYLTRYGDRFPEVAFFLTTGGTSIEKVLRAMAELIGKAPRATLGLRQKTVRRGEWRAELAAFADALKGEAAAGRA